MSVLTSLLTRRGGGPFNCRSRPAIVVALPRLAATQSGRIAMEPTKRWSREVTENSDALNCQAALPIQL
jgi:hypothetical protein